MPIYEYECQKCGVMEIEQRITADRLVKCPECNSKKFKKLISLSAFHLKGTGWYTTDYAKKDEKGGDKDKSSDSSDKSAKSLDSKDKTKDKKADSKKSETKPKSESKTSTKSSDKSKSKSSSGASASA